MERKGAFFVMEGIVNVDFSTRVTGLGHITFGEGLFFFGKYFLSRSEDFGRDLNLGVRLRIL